MVACSTSQDLEMLYCSGLYIQMVLLTNTLCMAAAPSQKGRNGLLPSGSGISALVALEVTSKRLLL